ARDQDAAPAHGTASPSWGEHISNRVTPVCLITRPVSRLVQNSPPEPVAGQNGQEEPNMVWHFCGSTVNASFKNHINYCFITIILKVALQESLVNSDRR